MLDDSYDRMKGRMILKIEAESHKTLVTDSWTNIRGEAIVNYVLVTPNGEAMFHSGDPTGAESHTGIETPRHKHREMCTREIYYIGQGDVHKEDLLRDVHIKRDLHRKIYYAL
ncbi:uncharacterized protein V1513DRAFT_443055, partial [Lipomyces chichibuensis]|uniref:uncharacterized protein n=1 Tax=Lipomyces chichibuensis TaxID=1546026 RepID=UPI0033442BA2